MKVAPSSGESAVRLMWSLMSTGVPGFQLRLDAAGPVGEHHGLRARGGGGAHRVHDPAHAVALVVVRAGADDERVLAARRQHRCAACRRAPRAPAAENPVTSVAGIVAVVSPMRSAALAHPLPRVRAMSWCGTPVSSAISAAATAAISNGSPSSSGCIRPATSRRSRSTAADLFRASSTVRQFFSECSMASMLSLLSWVRVTRVDSSPPSRRVGDGVVILRHILSCR